MGVRANSSTFPMGFFPSEPRSQEELISLPSDRHFICFRPFWTRKAGFILEMDTVPSGDC